MRARARARQSVMSQKYVFTCPKDTPWWKIGHSCFRGLRHAPLYRHTDRATRGHAGTETDAGTDTDTHTHAQAHAQPYTQTLTQARERTHARASAQAREQTHAHAHACAQNDMVVSKISLLAFGKRL